MARKITVPQGFHADFAYYCDRAGLDAGEREEMRQAVRSDFEQVGKFVMRAATVYRFCDRQFGGVPTLEQVREYLKSRCWSPSDENIFMRYGPLLLAEVCAAVGGHLPMPDGATWWK